MWRVIPIIIFMAVFVAILVPLGIENDNAYSHGMRGCCKQRDSVSDRNWYRNGLDYRQCDRLNQRRDNDDMLEQSGTVWWDLQC